MSHRCRLSSAQTPPRSRLCARTRPCRSSTCVSGIGESALPSTMRRVPSGERCTVVQQSAVPSVRRVTTFWPFHPQTVTVCLSLPKGTLKNPTDGATRSASAAAKVVDDLPTAEVRDVGVLRGWDGEHDAAITATASANVIRCDREVPTATHYDGPEPDLVRATRNRSGPHLTRASASGRGQAARGRERPRKAAKTRQTMKDDASDHSRVACLTRANVL
jgi:hypothetical protein